MSVTRPMFPHTVDSTILAAFRSCPQKAKLTYVDHWKPQNESVHLVAGGAFAAGVEVARRAYYVEGQSSEDAVAAGMTALMAHYGDFECPSDSAKSLPRMMGALEFYFDNYPLGGEGSTPITLGEKKAIEFSFAEPLDILHPVTGNPILYTGRADMIGHAYGGIFPFDEKTTSSLGPTWSRQWELRSQFTGYVWAAQKAGINAQGAIVRGVSILKTKYDTQQTITYRSAWELERWEKQVVRDIQRMIRAWAEGYWDYNLDNACNEYGGCGLRQVCKMKEPEDWLPNYYEQRVWDPLARRQLSVDEWHQSWQHDPEEAGRAAIRILQIP